MNPKTVLRRVAYFVPRLATTTTLKVCRFAYARSVFVLAKCAISDIKRARVHRIYILFTYTYMYSICGAVCLADM